MPCTLAGGGTETEKTMLAVTATVAGGCNGGGWPAERLGLHKSCHKAARCCCCCCCCLPCPTLNLKASQVPYAAPA